MLVGNLADGRNVLYFKGERARRFDENDLGIGSHEGANAGADQRIVIGGLNAQALERTIAKGPGWVVNRIGHQQVIARLECGQQGTCQRRQSAGREHGPVRTFQFTQSRFQRTRRRIAMPAIGMDRPMHGAQRIHSGKQQRGCTINRSIDCASCDFLCPTTVCEQSFCMNSMLRHGVDNHERVCRLHFLKDGAKYIIAMKQARRW